MDDLWFELGQRRQRRSTQTGRDPYRGPHPVQGSAIQFVRPSGDQLDLMTSAPQRSDLGLDDAVLSARILGAVEAVNEGDTDRESSLRMRSSLRTRGHLEALALERADPRMPASAPRSKRRGRTAAAIASTSRSPRERHTMPR
jgi:hypothetical protein